MSTKKTYFIQKSLKKVQEILDQHKAEDVVTIDLENKSDLADYMIVASGLNSRHLQSLAQYLQEEIKGLSSFNPRIEGDNQSDWVLVDLGDIIVHLFKPEKRLEYDLESLWTLASDQLSQRN